MRTPSRVPPSLKFTVAICTLNRRHYLERAMHEVMNQLSGFPSGHLLVVDNGSSDDTLKYLNELTASETRVSLAQEAISGTYYARARAIEQATGDFLIFLDDDAVPRPGWLNAMLTALLSAPDVGAVGCSIEPIWEGPRPPWLSQRLLREIPVYEVAADFSPARFPSFPPAIALGIRLNGCARLWVSKERRTSYPLGRKGSLADGANFQMVAGEDNDLCEIYARNGYRVMFINSTRVGHAVPKERLVPEWFLKKFRSEGYLRIRLSRLTGRPAVNWHSIKMLVLLPAFAVLQPVRSALSPATGLLVHAYYLKCLGAWQELLWGERLKPLPYEAIGRTDSPPGSEGASSERGEATT
jgi:glucosyl-dolichyl phosphate glucuronosyltransferase